MEKKKKRPNFIDIIFVLLVLGVILVAWFLIHGSQGASADTVTRSYVVELLELNPDMADYLAVGDKVKDNIKNYDIGIVTNVEEIPAIATVVDEETGVIRVAEIPGKITLVVTIEAQTVETEKAISTVSGYDLRIGTAVSCTIGRLTASGYIIGMDR